MMCVNGRDEDPKLIMKELLRLQLLVVNVTASPYTKIYKNLASFGIHVGFQGIAVFLVYSFIHVSDKGARFYYRDSVI